MSSNASEIQWPPQDWRLRITRWPSSIRITIQRCKDRAQSFSFENLATDKPFVDFRILQWRRTRHLRQLTIMSDHRSDQYKDGVVVHAEKSVWVQGVRQLLETSSIFDRSNRSATTLLSQRSLRVPEFNIPLLDLMFMFWCFYTTTWTPSRHALTVQSIHIFCLGVHTHELRQFGGHA